MALGISEKRNFPRIALKAPLKYKIRGRQEFASVLTDDIGAGGVSFLNSAFISPKTPVELEFSLLSRALNPIGKVAWSSPLRHSNRYRTGVEFTELDPGQKNHLLEYINMQQALS